MKRTFHDPLEQACWDYFMGNEKASVKIVSNKAEDEIIPVQYFFRDLEQMPEIEKVALDMCRGKILDIGAGCGNHSLVLKRRGFDVNSLEIRNGLSDLIKERGIREVYHADIFNFKDKQFDTLLLLMNGIGLVGDLNGLDRFLQHAKSLLKTAGQVLLDSTDLLYLYRESDGSVRINLKEAYYGEVVYSFIYDDKIGDPFKWLFVDYSTLAEYADKNGYNCELIVEDKFYNYLARLY